MNTVLFRRQSINSVLCLTRSFLRYCSQDIIVYDDPSQYKGVMKPSRLKLSEPFEENPIERLFIGEIDYRLFEYPEITSLKEVEYLHDFTSIIEKNLDIIRVSEQHDPSTKLTNYEYSRKLQLFGLKTPTDYCGYGFSEPECAYIYETLACNPSLLKIIHENEEFGVDVISLFGSEEQKKKYMPKLVTGEMMVCFAHYESVPILNKEPLQTLAYNTSEGENFTLVGKKTLVYNANIADLIIVSANTSSEKNGNKQTFFLIDKNFSGVKVSEPFDVIGLNDAGFSEITFDKVVVPHECILGKLNEGENMFKKICALGRMDIGMQCSAMMRGLATDAIHYGIHNHLFKKPLREHYFMQRQLARLVIDTYMVESMTYMVSGRLYEFADPDVFLESLIVKVFAAEALQRGIENYLQLMNRESYKDDQLRELLSTSAFHSVLDDNNDNLKLYITSVGMEYAKEKRIHRWGKFIKYWKYVFDREIMEQTWRYNKGYDAETVTWFLHPQLDPYARILYQWIVKFDNVIEKIMRENKNGEYPNINYKFLKLADMLFIIYAMIATIGRASRSYCIGLRNCDLEMKIAISQTSVFNRQIEMLEQELLNFNDTEEKRIKKIGSRTIENGKYAYTHPYLQQKISANR